MRRTLLALALIVTAGASYAQTLSTDDPYNRPMIGRNDWVRQPGDQGGPGGLPADRNMAAAPMMTPAPQYMRSGPHAVAFKDEYGFRYDSEGNRLDARGNVISPHTR